jgi:DNA-binding CsgD family transcriptional regulator
LLERDAELEAVSSAVAAAKRGTGQAVFIEGAAGAGKSALIAAVVAGSDGDGLRILRAAGGELERGFAFGAIRQLFESVVVSAPAAERARLLEGAAAPAERVIDPSLDGSAGPAAEFAVLHAIYWLTSNLAAQAPLVIAVDDLHWVDEASLRALDYLSRRLADIPVALLGALRPAEPGAPAALLDALRSQHDAVTITPSPLSADAIAAIVRTELPEAGDELCAAFLAASAGNPLYLRELLRAVGASEPSAAAVAEAAVPSLGERVMRRIDAVAPEARALTRSMAVLGDGAQLSLAARHAELELGTAAGIAHKLVRLEVLAGEDPFSFVHPVVRSSVYAGLTVTERAAAHGRAAELLAAAGASPEAIGGHLTVLPPAGSDAVATGLLAAARDALARPAPLAAIAHLRRALEEEAGEPGRPVLLFELGRAEVAASDPHAIETLRTALELAQEPELRLRIAVALAEVLGAAGQWEAAVALVDEMRAAASDVPELLIELEASRAVMLAYDANLIETFDGEHDHLVELAQGNSWPAHAIAALLACVAACRGRSPDVVLPLVEQALEGGRLLRERGGGAWAAAQLLDTLISLEDYDRAIELATQVETEGRRTGSPLGLITGNAYRGWAHGRRGDMAASAAELMTIVDITVQSGMHMWLAATIHAFQDALVERAELAEAAEAMTAIELEPRFAATCSGAMLQETRGRVALGRGDRERALPDLRACAATYSALRMGPTRTPWRSMLALALPPDESEHAAALVSEELELARAAGSSRAIGVALRTTGVLAGGEDGIRSLRESITELERTEARLELARSEVELGAALRRQQQRAEAQEWLTAGMERAHRCGAERLTERADEELHAAGYRPRRPARTGADSLTPSELRVARSAAAGRSNREIAQDLYVSPKTVDTHLSHAYAKLGLAGQGARKGLAAALGDLSS